MDDPEAYKLSKVVAATAPTTQARTPPASTSAKLSPAKSAKKRSKSSKSEGL